jgi:hypothetical protein
MATTIESQNLQVAVTQNTLLPDEGPRVIPLLLDFTSTDTYTFDGQLVQATNELISILQTVFIDLSTSNVNLTLTVGGTGQNIVAKAGTQGYYSVLAPNPLRLSFSCPGGPLVPLMLMNMPIAGAVWSV